jgi:hypothetical protein
MVSQPLWLSTAGWNYIDIGVAGDGRCERDLRTVGREVRIDFNSGRDRQPPRLSTIPRYNPQISGILERDGVTTYGGVTKESGALCSCDLVDA